MFRGKFTDLSAYIRNNVYIRNALKQRKLIHVTWSKNKVAQRCAD